MRLALLLLLAWTLLGVPALCMAGSLLHDCECGAEIGCAHEEECSDDPCSDLLALPSSATGDFDEALLPAVPFGPTLSTGLAVPFEAAEVSYLSNLPFPPSQRPLLI